MESLLLRIRRGRLWLWTLCITASLCGIAGTESSATPALPGITIVSKALGLEFQTPKGWRLAIESTEQQLLLYGHAKKTSPLLRVRVFNGRRSPMERMPEMKRILTEAEAQVKTVSADRWQHEGRSFQTARATVKDGSAEFVALFTLVDQPKKVQHGFWLYGKAKDVEKHWKSVKASIATAKSVGTIGRPGARNEDRGEREPDSPDVLTDKETGLVLKKWPEGFSLDESSKDKLTQGGLLLAPTDNRVHKSTLFRVSALLDQKKNAAEKASESLSAQLNEDSSVQGSATISLRVAGLSATKHRWNREAPGGPFVHETYFFQKGTTLFKIEFSASQSWAKARSRRTLVRDFIAGVRF